MGRIGTIINKKGKMDAKKAKIFTKLGRYIMVAAREGGADIEYNSALKAAVEKAKTFNMPKENIDRAIKKGSGNLEGVVYTELTYEGYGPGGIAVLVECLTDNTNRTAANVRSYFVKGNGNLGTNGCVSFMFDHLGVIAITKDDSISDSDIEMDIIESGADDFSVEDDYYEVLTAVENFSEVRDYLLNKGYNFKMAELRYLPQNMVELVDDNDITKMNKLIELLEDDDDIQNIYHNWRE